MRFSCVNPLLRLVSLLTWIRPQGNLATSRKVRIFNPIHDTLRARLRERASEFTTSEPTTIWVGTYNLNGKSPGEESLMDWMFPVDGASRSPLKP